MSAENRNNALPVFTEGMHPEEHTGRSSGVPELTLEEFAEILKKAGWSLSEDGRMVPILKPSPFGETPSTGNALLDAMTTPEERFEKFGPLSPIDADTDLFDI